MIRSLKKSLHRQFTGHHFGGSAAVNFEFSNSEGTTLTNYNPNENRNFKNSIVSKTRLNWFWKQSDTFPFLGTADTFGKCFFYHRERVKFKTVVKDHAARVNRCSK